MEVVAEYEYEALQDDELTLHLGDIIKNVRTIEEEGWMEGDLNGRRGLFPDNFVKELKKETKDVKETKNETKEACQPRKREKSAGNVAHLVQRISTIGIPTGGFQPQPPVPLKKPKKRQCKVLYEYQPQNEDELELKMGDIVDITEEVEDGWWSGTSNSKSGLFPSNFVKELDVIGENGESNNVTTEDTDATDGTNNPTSPQPSIGSRVITQPKKVVGVGFGDIFKDGSFKLRQRVINDSEEKKDKVSAPPSLPSTAKPADSNTTESQRAFGENKSKVKEYCKVVFPFEATNVDELDLKEGEVIHVLTKDTGELGWWRGEVGSKEGVFPDNFVVLLSESEKETFASRGSLKLAAKNELEEKPRKPPPPSKTAALKPDVPSADKKPHPIRGEDKVDMPVIDHKPTKPVAPLVHPKKKPVPPPGKSRVGSIPPKRPDKPSVPSPNLKHNGEAPSSGPKLDLETTVPTKPKTLSGDWGEKTLDTDLISFDDLSSTSEKLSHPTTSRPKMPGRRLPAHFVGGHSPTKEVNVEKSFKNIDEDTPKLKLAEPRKPSTSSVSLPPSHLKHVEAKSSTPISGMNSITDGASPESRGRSDPEMNFQLEELKSQMKELLLSVELLKAQQMKEITDLRGELDEERVKRVALQMEVEKLKRSIHST